MTQTQYLEKQGLTITYLPGKTALDLFIRGYCPLLGNFNIVCINYFHLRRLMVITVKICRPIIVFISVIVIFAVATVVVVNIRLCTRL